MADIGEAPGPSRQDKGKAKVGEPSDFTSADDQSEKYKLGPGSGISTYDCNNLLVLKPFKNLGKLQSFSVALPGDIKPSPQVSWSDLSKTLTAQDTNPIDPVLYMNASEAYSLTGSFKLLNPTPIPSPMKLPVFEGNRVYNMLLSYLSTNKYSITQDWGHFVRRHELRAGDQILFYRYSTADSLSSSYEIQIVGREESKIITQPPKLIDLNRQLSPGSRGTPIPAYKLTKTLSVHQGSIIKLWFDAIEAWILTGCLRVLDDCPCGTLLMSLLVYDESNMPYDTALTHMKHNNGKVVCTLDAGWHRFVDSHGLKAGDRVTICKIKGEKYYTLEYTRSGLSSGRGTSGVGPSGSGQ